MSRWATWSLGMTFECYKAFVLHVKKKDIESNTLTVGDFHTPLSKIDISSKQRIHVGIVALNDILDQMDLTDIQKLSPQRSKIYVLFKSTQNIFKDRPCDRTQNKPK